MELTAVRGIITGAARGLGQAFAVELLQAGAQVTVGDINERGLKSLAAATTGLPGRLAAHKLDVTQETSVSEFVRYAADQMSYINVLVNNAGILRDGHLANPENGWVKKLPTSQWQQVLDVNLTGPFLMTREVINDCLSRRVSPVVVVNISSVSSAGNPGQSNYSASKAGLDSLARTWAIELAPFGVRVGGIAPGVIDTPILHGISPEVLHNLQQSIPLRRIGTPYEVWLALKFIIECDYFTGRTLAVDGGLTF
ncbi:MAG TPA: SDR family oxidoreductase [Bryobacteraceae bacterium]|jgi:3-oxoacyl-[acyl-carrier protein] reductase|nr:SDR family oxidoreductase [Bryobacteraceae bacterium]